MTNPYPEHKRTIWTAPVEHPKRQWVGLTDEERKELMSKSWNEYLRGNGDDSFGWYLSEAVEAKLKEKNNA